LNDFSLLLRNETPAMLKVCFFGDVEGMLFWDKKREALIFYDPNFKAFDPNAGSIRGKERPKWHIGADLSIITEGVCVPY
jgi:hypothetical protein